MYYSIQTNKNWGGGQEKILHTPSHYLQIGYWLFIFINDKKLKHILPFVFHPVNFFLHNDWDEINELRISFVKTRNSYVGIPLHPGSCSEAKVYNKALFITQR
jgi:hypothetical protein